MKGESSHLHKLQMVSMVIQIATADSVINDVNNCLRDNDKHDAVLFFFCDPIFDMATMFKRYVGPLMICEHQVLQ